MANSYNLDEEQVHDSRGFNDENSSKEGNCNAPDVSLHILSYD